MTAVFVLLWLACGVLGVHIGLRRVGASRPDTGLEWAVCGMTVVFGPLGLTATLIFSVT